MRTLLIICLCLLFSLGTYAEENKSTHELGLKVFVGIPKAGYGALIESYVPYVNEPCLYPDVSPVFGLSLDSRWYLTKPSKCRFAINARWGDVSYSYYNGSFLQYQMPPTLGDYVVSNKYWISIIDISTLGVGPLGSFFFNDNMALDVFYNVAPNILILREDVSDNYSLAYNKHTFALGVAHYVGLSFSYKILQVGSELKLGTPVFQNWGERNADNYDYNAQLGYSKFRATNLRFFVGVKF